MSNSPPPSLTLLAAFDLLRNKKSGEVTSEEIAGLRARLEANPSLFASVGGAEAVEKFLAEAEEAKKAEASQPAVKPDNSLPTTADSVALPARKTGRTFEVLLYAAAVLAAAGGLYFFAWEDTTSPVTPTTSIVQGTGSQTAAAAQPSQAAPKNSPALPPPEEPETEAPAEEPADPNSWLGWRIDQNPNPFQMQTEWDNSDPGNPVPATTLRTSGGPVRLTRLVAIGEEDRWLMVDVRPSAAAFPGGQIEVRIDDRKVAAASIGAGESDWPLYVALEGMGKDERKLDILYTPGAPRQQVTFWNAGLTASQIKKPMPESPLITALRSDDPAVRAQGAVAAAQAVDPLVLTTLVRATGDKIREVRRAAVTALRQYNAGTPPFVVAALIQNLNDPDREVRRLASQTLMAFDCDPTWEALGQAMTSNSDSQLRLHLVQQLCGRNHSAVQTAYEEAVASEDDALRKAAITCLNHRPNRQVTELLVRALDDPEPSVRQTAAEALAGRNDEAAEAALIAALSTHSDFVVRRAAARRLHRSPTPKALPAIRTAVSTPDDPFRRALPGALEKLSGEEAAALLKDLFGADDLTVRHQAADALSKRSEADELMLEIFSSSQDSTLRAYSVRRLGKMGVPPAAVSALQTAARAPSAVVRCEALEVIRAARAEVFQQKMQQRPSRSQAVEALGAVPWPDTLKLVIALLDDPVPRVQQVAATALCADPHPDADAFMPRLLASPDRTIRQLAAARYPHIAAPSAKTLEFHKACLLDPNAGVRAAAIPALLQIRSREALALLHPLIDDPEYLVRAAAQASRRRNPAEVQDEALLPAAAKAPGPEAIAVLVGLLSAPKSSIRQAAAKALGRRTELPAEQALCQAAQAHADLFVRRAAVLALAAKPPAPPINDVLRKALRDSDAEVRELALPAMSRVPGPETVRGIAPLVSDPVPSIRLAAVALLAQNPAPEAEQALLPVLEQSDWQLRGQAIERFTRVPSPRAIAGLSAAATAPEQDTRGGAIRALGRLKDPTVTPVLVRALDDPDHHVRSLAAEALRLDDSPESTQAMLSALTANPHAEVRIQAATKFEAQPNPAAREPLTLAAGHEDDTLRIAALKALGKLPEVAATNVICAGLSDPVPEVRLSAAALLTDRRDATAEAAMLEALRSHGDVAVRRAAASRFQTLPSPQSVPVLAVAMKNVDDVLRLLAAQALKASSAAEAIDPLVEALGDPSEHVRRTALEALAPRAEPRAQSAVAAYKQKTQDVQ